MTQDNWQLFDVYTHMADILRALMWPWTSSIKRFPNIYALVPSWYCDLSALSTTLEDDIWQVRFKLKEDAKKALDSKETDDERRLKTLLVEDERPLGFPTHWHLFEVDPEPILAASLNPLLRSLDFVIQTYVNT